ncbi:MAG TPA: hypothetical protein VK445_09170, partial [Dissulfurispiraceae bacterium]|nr:hypothetical protein [Dissulfurispiraceae bacterium]
VFHIVCLSWVFFRAVSTHDAFTLLQGITRIHWIPEYAIAFQFLAMFTIPLFFMDLINEHRKEEYLFERAHPYLRTLLAVAVSTATLLFAGSKSNAFIYFQF